MPTHDFSDIGDVLGFELLRGTITAINTATDTATVSVGGKAVTALLFYHCTSSSILRSNGAIEGAAKGFSVGDQVIVLKKHDDSVAKVIGHVYGIKRCRENDGQYFIFYKDSGILKISRCNIGDTITVLDTKKYSDVSLTNFAKRLRFLIKRFTHNVPAGGVITARDLYFIATSLYINPAPFVGWTAFATASPTFAIVTNNANTKITISDQVIADLNSVNATVNAAHSYTPDPSGNDYWHILGDGEPGDCEDFALTKAKLLLDMGYPASAIHVEVGIYLDESNVQRAHAWLVVQTTAGDYALDIGSNSITANAGLTFSGREYYVRRRQIGSNWAFISGFGWLLSVENSETRETLYDAGYSYSYSKDYIYYYILDPLLNIIYPISYYEKPESQMTQHEDYPILPIANQINFSTDNNSIFVYSSQYGPQIKAYRLDENQLSLVSTTTPGVYGLLDRDGNMIEYEGDGGADTWDIVSRDGYYDLEYINMTETLTDTGMPPATGEEDEQFYRTLTHDTEFDADPQCIHQASVLYEYIYHSGNWTGPTVVSQSFYENRVIYYRTLANREFGEFFYSAQVSNEGDSSGFWDQGINWSNLILHTPFGESFDSGNANQNYFTKYWGQIDTSDTLIQSFMLKGTGLTPGENVYRVYRGGVSIFDDIKTAVGVSADANILGIALIPQADRLNS